MAGHDDDPVEPLPWFQTAEGNRAPSVDPPWENAKSRRHPERRDDADDGDKPSKGGEHGE